MPELPEVETIRRALEPRLLGRRLLEAQFFAWRVARRRGGRIAAQLRGQIVRALRRYGKHLVVEFESGLLLAIHLGMTGSLLWNGERGPHTRALFIFDNGRLLFDDPRQFGRIELAATLPERIARLGPEAPEISKAEFVERLQHRRGALKPLLLNQTFLRGLGNIYTDEALFRAGIHPRAIAARLSPQRAARLHRAIREVLQAAIASGGTSVSDYVDAEGHPGRFQLQLKVYGRTGEPCPRCSTAIRRTVIAQRGTHFCPKCQRL